VLGELRALGDPAAVAGMARFGIRSSQVLGIPVPALRAMAKRIGRDHALAEDLWRSGILEARILSSLLGDPKLVTEPLMDSWAADFDSWAVCDGACGKPLRQNEIRLEESARLEPPRRGIREARGLRADGFAGRARQNGGR
jgi:3-methyladenine DNA glycosylase AlkD